MSIHSVQSRMAEIHSILTPNKTAAQTQQSQETLSTSFKTLLRASRQSNAVDVAAAMGLDTQAAQTGSLTLRTLQAPTAMVTWARQGSARLRSASQTGSGWTAPVDTSDGMLQKAAPYMDIIREASSIYQVPINVIMGVIKAESDYQQYCVSDSGAMGLMQIMPVNAEEFGVTDAYDPRQNIMCGTEEIARHLASYNGDLRLALVAYNTGAGNVARRGVTSSTSAAYERIPTSVRAYADRVLRYAGLAI